jgi:hypothetical protein
MKYVRVGILIACAALISPVAAYAKSGSGAGKSTHDGGSAAPCKAGQKSTAKHPCT